MKIGLLSDTHSYLDQRIFEYFASCDEIWHAGDIGAAFLADALEKFKPLRAVYGNIDDPVIRKKFPEDNWFTCEGMTILITHIAGAPPHYNPRIKRLLAERKPDILVTGHSHILRVVRDKKYDMMYFNPGAAGNQGFHHMKTLLRFEINGKEVSNMEVIELGRRGSLTGSEPIPEN